MEVVTAHINRFNLILLNGFVYKSMPTNVAVKFSGYLVSHKE